MANTNSDVGNLPKYLPMLMWSLCAVFYGYQYFLQVSPSVMTYDLMRTFNVNATMLGNLAACYFYTYAGMQIPVGVICDRFGTRRPMIIASMLCALGSFLFGCSNIFGVAVLGRLFIGLGGSFAVVGGLCIANLWLPIRFFALLTGGVVTIGMLGAAGGQFPLALLVNKLHWNNTMILLGCVGLVITIMMFFVLRDPISEPRKFVLKTKKSLFDGLKQVCSNRQIWLLAIYGGLMFMPISVFGSLWGIPFLMRKYAISNSAAGSMVVMMFFGFAVGSPLFGWLSDYISRRKRIMWISNVGALICLLSIIYFPFPEDLTAIFLFLYGVFCGGFLVCFATAREINSGLNTGVAMGFMNTLNMLGGAFIQPLVGILLDGQWNGAMEQGVRTYSMYEFEVSFLIIPICSILALVTLFFIKETYCCVSYKDII